MLSILREDSRHRIQRQRRPTNLSHASRLAVSGWIHHNRRQIMHPPSSFPPTTYLCCSSTDEADILQNAPIYTFQDRRRVGRIARNAETVERFAINLDSRCRGPPEGCFNKGLRFTPHSISVVKSWKDEAFATVCRLFPFYRKCRIHLSQPSLLQKHPDKLDTLLFRYLSRIYVLRHSVSHFSGSPPYFDTCCLSTLIFPF